MLIIVCKVYIHKRYWEFGLCCSIKASNERSATTATGVEVSANVGSPARTMVDSCEVSTETIETRSTESSEQTDELSRCHFSSQTDVFDRCHVSTETDALDHCHASAQTEMLKPCHVSTETDVLDLNQCHMSIQTDIGYDRLSIGNGSVISLGDVPRCEHIHSGPTIMTSKRRMRNSLFNNNSK
jgi:hypothetical protein